MQPRSRLARPDVVFLDLGDTLVRVHPTWAAVYRTVFPEFGISVADDDFHQAFAAVFARWEGNGPFEATEEASYQRLKALDGLAFGMLGYHDLPDSFFRRVDQVFRERSAWWVYPDVLPGLDALVGAGVRLAVISNWSWSAPELIHDLQLARHFEAMIISARVGYQKPHREIFEHALKLMRVASERAIHVGDSVSADVQGARGAGIRPVLISRGSHVHGDGHGRDIDLADVPVVSDMYGLLDLLGIDRPAELTVS
jgi:putative hydrolase of the HAD superfamily